MYYVLSLSLCSLCLVLGWASHSQAGFVLSDAIKKSGWMLIICVCVFYFRDQAQLIQTIGFPGDLKKQHWN